MKSLIIGASGFVGPYLIQSIKNNLHSEIVATRSSINSSSSGNDILFSLNLLDKTQVSEILKYHRPDYIFHLAAQSSISYSWERPDITVNVNVKGTINLLNSIRELNYSPRVLIVGSGEEYGHVSPQNVPIKEDCPLSPGNIYALTKACQNMMASTYANAYGLQLIMVRAFNHIGPGQLPTFVVSDFCRQVARIEKGLQSPIIKVGNLSARRDFTDVRDVANAYVSLIQFGKSGETYNVGSGKSYTIDEILQIILNYSKMKIEVEVDSEKLRPVDVPVIEADITKLFNATGWKPQITLEQTISETIDYWRNNI